MENKNKTLKVKLENDVITISIGIDTLVYAAKNSPTDLFYHKLWNPEGIIKKVANKTEFAEDVVRELQSEAEDGTTLVHIMFDKAIVQVVENGTTACEYKSRT